MYDVRGSNSDLSEGTISALIWSNSAKPRKISG
jgi:hypothetical protein